MGATRGTLILLRLLAEGPVTQHELLDALGDSGLRRDVRTLRRWLAVLNEAGFDVERKSGRYELRESPVRLALDGYEALATLSVLESLMVREPVYGSHLASAVDKLRNAIPAEPLKFADGGGIEFALDSTSAPPEDLAIMDVLRRAAHQSRRAEILYHSLRSDTVRRRVVEPIRVYHAQKAHRLDAYERKENRVSEFRINRVREAKILPEKFSPEAHRKVFERVEVRLSEKAFLALGKTVIPDRDVGVELLDDGGAVIAGATPSVFWTVRDICAIGPEAEVLGGPHFKACFLAFLKDTLNRYS